VPSDARQKMIQSAVTLLATRGLDGTAFSDVLAHSGAPRGSIYHHFPDGKDQLVSEALGFAGEYAVAWVARYAQTARRPTPSGLFAHLLEYWRRELTRHDFELIRRQLRRTPGEPLPSIRPLAEELRVNRNTVAKAYAELESQRVIETIAGKGCFVRANDTPYKKTVRLELLTQVVDEAVVQAHHLQVPRGELVRLVEERFETFEQARARAAKG